MVVIAASPLRRLLGLAACVPSKIDGLDDASIVMVFPGCASVHTWFMRRAIDIVFAGPEGEVLARFDSVPPWRIRSCLGLGVQLNGSLRVDGGARRQQRFSRSMAVPGKMM